jgi:hypothetical protein
MSFCYETQLTPSGIKPVFPKIAILNLTYPLTF